MMTPDLGGGRPIVQQEATQPSFPVLRFRPQSVCSLFYLCVYLFTLFPPPEEVLQRAQPTSALLPAEAPGLAQCLTRFKCSIKIFWEHEYMNERLRWLQLSIHLFIQQACFVRLLWAGLLST